MSYDGFRSNQEKASTPVPLAGLFPLGYDVEPKVEAATIERYLDLAPGYIGEAMLSPHYGVWAAWIGDRARSLRFFEEGYAKLVMGRFWQTLEHTVERYPDAPKAGPFSANLGGFLTDLIYGLPGIRIGAGEPSTWPRRPVPLRNSAAYSRAAGRGRRGGPECRRRAGSSFPPARRITKPRETGECDPARPRERRGRHGRRSACVPPTATLL